MLQIVVTLAIFMVLVIPMGTYMYHIATKEKTFAEHIEDKDTAVIQGIRRCVKKHRTNRDLYKK